MSPRETSLGLASDYRTSEWGNLKTNQRRPFPACVIYIARVCPRKKKRERHLKRKKNNNNPIYVGKKSCSLFKCFKKKMNGRITSNFHLMSQNTISIKADAESILYAFFLAIVPS